MPSTKYRATAATGGGRIVGHVFEDAALEFVAGDGVVGFGECAVGEVAVDVDHLVTVDGGVDGLARGVAGLAAA